MEETKMWLFVPIQTTHFDLGKNLYSGKRQALSVEFPMIKQSTEPQERFMGFLSMKPLPMLNLQLEKEIDK